MACHKRFCVGLTGSIASGKSTVASYFEKLGIDIINADHIAKALVQYGEPALQEIVNYFGTTVLMPNGELNRALLREWIAHNSDQRTWLENLLHPLIREQIKASIQQCKSPYCIIEIPLLTDKTPYPYLNRILLVQADPEIQINRLMARDKNSRQQALAMLATTKAVEDKRRAIADDALMNLGSVEELHNKVATLHTLYLREAQKSH